MGMISFLTTSQDAWVAPPLHPIRRATLVWANELVAKRVARTGMWSLHSTDHEPENLDRQIVELLGNLTSEMDVWQDLAHMYRVDLYCGLLVGRENDGLTVSPSSLAALGQRGIQLALDIYGLE